MSYSTTYRRLRYRGAWAPLAVAMVVMSMTACGVSIPTDPDGTLQRVESSGELRVGATPAGDALTVDGNHVSGPLADLVEGFAHAHGARVEWTVASEETLVDELEDGSLDLAAGGMTDATPWVDRVSVTRGFTGVDGSDGKPLVVILPLGENALQFAIEKYFDDQGAS